MLAARDAQTNGKSRNRVQLPLLPTMPIPINFTPCETLLLHPRIVAAETAKAIPSRWSRCSSTRRCPRIHARRHRARLRRADRGRIALAAAADGAAARPLPPRRFRPGGADGSDRGEANARALRWRRGAPPRHLRGARAAGGAPRLRAAGAAVGRGRARAAARRVSPLRCFSDSRHSTRRCASVAVRTGEGGVTHGHCMTGGPSCSLAPFVG